mmetsp:Transcript_64108/g.149297  ORF Transcript_64108/g.149297 Transcript_64108/m.149297 type:complete len:123 (+) Transcript_64108:1-369(+)
MNLKPWLENFEARQFVIIPAQWYHRSSENRRHAISQIAEQSGAALDPRAVRKASRANARQHPPLSADLDPATAARLWAAYFGPDTKQLVELLAHKVWQGLIIAGYKGSAAAQELEAHLLSSW